MGVIAFAIEMGSGFGHIKRCLPIARAAADLGHRPLFLVTNPSESASVLAREGIEVRSAPGRWQGRARSGRVATSYADIMGDAGFADIALLREVTADWDILLEQLRPLAVVSELSPFLNLAIHGAGIPLLVVGYGFALPPPHLATFPRLRSGVPFFDEPSLLNNVTAICRQRGRAAPRGLPSLFEGQAHAVTGLEALDPYSEQRRDRAVGPPALEASLTRGEPKEQVFAYLLGDAPATLDILRALASSGVHGQAFVRRGTTAHREAVARSRIAYLEHPAPIKGALERAALIVHHGSMLTSEEALVAGRPQLVVPLYLEHLFTARALASLGIARVVRPPPTPDGIASVLASALQDASMSNRAFTIAETFWRTSPPPADLPMQLLRRVIPA